MNELIPFLLFAISATITPGPNNIMLMNSGLNFGLQKSLPHYLGICFGFPTMILLVALGFSAIFTEFAWIKDVLKIVGSIYMLYLAWQILITSTKPDLLQVRKPFSFLQAVLFQWINPKAWLIAASTISIFTLVTNYFRNAIMIGFAYFCIGVPCVGAWLLFGKFMQQILKTDRHRVWFNVLMALALVSSILMIWVD